MDLDDMFSNLGQMQIGEEGSNSLDNENENENEGDSMNVQKDSLENYNLKKDMKEEDILHISSHEEWENFKKTLFNEKSLVSGKYGNKHHLHKKDKKKKKDKEEEKKGKKEKKNKSIKGMFSHVSNYEDESEEESSEEEEEEEGYYTPLYNQENYQPMKSNAITISNDRDLENFKKSIFKKKKSMKGTFSHISNNEDESEEESSEEEEETSEEEEEEEEGMDYYTPVYNRGNYERMKSNAITISNDKDWEKFKGSVFKKDKDNGLNSFGILNEFDHDSSFSGNEIPIHIKCEKDFENFKRQFSSIKSSSSPSSSLSNQIEIMKAKNIAAFFINDEMNVTKLTDKERIKFCNQMNHLEEQLSTPEKKLKLEMIKSSKIKVNISPQHDLKDMSNLIQFNGLVKKHGIDNIFSHKCEDLLDLVHKRTLHAKNEKQ